MSELETIALQKQSQGNFSDASELFEKACQFEKASRCALQANDPSRALILAAFANNDSLQQEAILVLVQNPAKADATLTLLQARGHCRCAGRLASELGEHLRAGTLYLGANDWLWASRAFQKGGDARLAARALDSGLRLRPEDAELLLAMGEILLSHGKVEAALKHLQRIQESSECRAAALSLMIPCFERLSMSSAAFSAKQELKALTPESVTRFHNSGDLPAVQTSPEQVIAGRYQIHHEVSSSVNARVFAGHDRLRDQEVAIKQILASASTGAGRDALERLIREARVLERVRGANIVPLVEILSHSGLIVTQWMTGGSLAARLAVEPLTPAKAAEIVCSVLTALAEAHRLGILHRDIKPSNILFDALGASYLADFGAAHLSDSSATATAGIIGTLSYMAPEQRRGEPATGQSDIFGVGAIFYEMLVQQSPANEGFPAPSQVNPELSPEHDRVVLAMLENRAGDRPADAISARNLVTSLQWPNQAPRRIERSTTARKSYGMSGRLKPLADGTYMDLWIERTVQLVPVTEDSLQEAREFARTEREDGRLVLRVDKENGVIWYG